MEMKHIKLFETYVKENHSYKEEYFYDDILSASDAPNGEQDAIERAKGMDWSEIETTKQRLAYMDFIDNVNGVDIWYCFGSDDYYFSDPEENE